AHKATTNPQKPIVVIGIWLWMVPMLLIGIGLTILGSGAFVEELRRGELRGIFGLPIAALGLVFVWIASVILVRTTVSFLRQSNNKGLFGGNRDVADEDEDT